MINFASTIDSDIQNVSARKHCLAPTWFCNHQYALYMKLRKHMQLVCARMGSKKSTTRKFERHLTNTASILQVFPTVPKAPGK